DVGAALRQKTPSLRTTLEPESMATSARPPTGPRSPSGIEYEYEYEYEVTRTDSYDFQARMPGASRPVDVTYSS
ncbi:MAG TPA: hypothetical protein VEW70_12075, partial [Burkholderiales bacterium]|nr:hypothetical protein [Burkholderiales bacterium]